MATTNSHGHAADTDHGRLTIAAAREACETVLETLLRPTSFNLRAACEPDGDWFRVDNTPLRKTWTEPDGDGRVQLATEGISSTWQLEHHTPDGKCVVLERGLERETAYTRAEQYMADLSSVEARCRSGRAEE